MSKIFKMTILTGVVAVGASVALAQQNPLEIVQDGCKKEITEYCSNVTPGQGRGLACLYAHGDKLSGRCEYALYDAAAQLERAVAALTYVANECDEDIEEQCASVEAGEGRLVACLSGAGEKVSARCRAAMGDVGLAAK